MFRRWVLKKSCWRSSVPSSCRRKHPCRTSPLLVMMELLTATLSAVLMVEVDNVEGHLRCRFFCVCVCGAVICYACCCFDDRRGQSLKDMHIPSFGPQDHSLITFYFSVRNYYTNMTYIFGLGSHLLIGTPFSLRKESFLFHFRLALKNFSDVFSFPIRFQNPPFLHCV